MTVWPSHPAWPGMGPALLASRGLAGPLPYRECRPVAPTGTTGDLRVGSPQGSTPSSSQKSPAEVPLPRTGCPQGGLSRGQAGLQRPSVLAGSQSPRRQSIQAQGPDSGPDLHHSLARCLGTDVPAAPSAPQDKLLSVVPLARAWLPVRPSRPLSSVVVE